MHHCIYRIYPQYQPWYESFVNTDVSIRPFYLQTKVRSLYHLDLETSSISEYALDDMVSKKDIVIDDDLDPRGLWEYSSDNDHSF